MWSFLFSVNLSERFGKYKHCVKETMLRSIIPFCAHIRVAEAKTNLQKVQAIHLCDITHGPWYHVL